MPIADSTLTPGGERGIIGGSINDGVAVKGIPGGASNVCRNRFSNNGFGCAMSDRMVRQLANVSAEVLAVPPPPLPVFPEPYSFRFADPDGDAAMISEWMNRPHLASTWHYDRPADEWRRHLSIQFEGNYSRPYVFSLDGDPLGYIELFRAAQDHISTVYDADPYDVGMHGAIADPEMVRKGHGRIVVTNIISGLFSAEPRCRRLLGDTGIHPDTEGRRFWEQFGGVFLGEHHIPALNYRLALFVWPRSPDDVPVRRDDT